MPIPAHDLLLAGQPSAAPAWTPASVSPMVWLDASDAATVHASGSNITSVDDKSGNGNGFTGGGGTVPTTGTATINSLNTFQFPVAGSLLSRGTLSTSLTQPLTVMLVFKINNTANYRMHDTTSRIIVGVTGTAFGIFAGTTLNSATALNTSAHQIVAIYNGASSLLYLDGTQIASGNAGTAGTGISVDLGGSTPNFIGLIGEYVLSAGAIGSTDRASWNTYCAKWGL